MQVCAYVRIGMIEHILMFFMCVCMCMQMCVCVRANSCMRVHAHVCVCDLRVIMRVRVRACVCLCVCMQVRIYAHGCGNVYACRCVRAVHWLHVHEWACVGMPGHVWACVHALVCMCMYTVHAQCKSVLMCEKV